MVLARTGFASSFIKSVFIICIAAVVVVEASTLAKRSRHDHNRWPSLIDGDDDAPARTRARSRSVLVRVIGERRKKNISSNNNNNNSNRRDLESSIQQPIPPAAAASTLEESLFDGDKKNNNNDVVVESGGGVYVDKPVLRGQFHKWGAILYPPLFGLPLHLRAVKAAVATDVGQSTSSSSSLSFLSWKLLSSNPLVRATFLFSFAAESILVVSATLHTYPWKTERWHQVTRKLDFTAIFFGIALFYSSMAKMLMGHHPLFSQTIEPLVWTCAILGTILKWLVPDAPHWVNAVVFLVQGWAGLPLMPTLFRSTTFSEAVGMISGGVFVTLGALAYSLQWPYNTSNKPQREIVFGPHEMFHVGTLFMALSFWYTMWMMMKS